MARDCERAFREFTGLKDHEIITFKRLVNFRKRYLRKGGNKEIADWALFRIHDIWNESADFRRRVYLLKSLGTEGFPFNSCIGQQYQIIVQNDWFSQYMQVWGVNCAQWWEFLDKYLAEKERLELRWECQGKKKDYLYYKTRRASGSEAMKRIIRARLIERISAIKSLKEKLEQEIELTSYEAGLLSIKLYRKGVKASELTVSLLEELLVAQSPDRLTGALKLSYKNLVHEYFGIEFDNRKQAPKLSKQLSKAGITATQKELQAFAELEEWIKQSLCTRDEKALYIDTRDFTIPNNVDTWGFANSCNRSMRVGSETHLILKNLGYEYLKVYAETGGRLVSYARAYFYREVNDLAHAGMYSEIKSGTGLNTTAYNVTSLLLAVVFGKKVDDFCKVDGMTLESGMTYKNKDNEELFFWSNMSAYNEYTVLSTRKDLLATEYAESGAQCPWYEVSSEDIYKEDSAGTVKYSLEGMN